MWIDDCDSFLEICRGHLPYYLFIILPIFIIISPANLAAASHEFPAFRMGQYDLYGLPHGCRSTQISLEARSLNSWSTSRHCVIAQAEDLTKESFQKIRQKAGALIVIVPDNFNKLTQTKKEHITSLEEYMMYGSETMIPVYFIKWNPQLQVILEDLEHNYVSDDKTGSAAEALVYSVSASSYQVVVSANQALAKTDSKIATMHGKLTGSGTEDKLPTIALVAHYDSIGVAPELSFGAESNGSGLAMLLELARVFSLLYSSGKTRPHFNLVFIATGAGKLNYLGSKKWLEDQLDGLESSIIQDVSYVLCLDSVSSSDTLYMHVSKPPKETSTGGLIYRELKAAADGQGHSGVEGVHKKINLAEESLAWEHERFSIRRLPAATLSSLKSFEVPIRSTILDTLQDENVDTLYKHTNVVAEALVRHMYNISNSFFEPVGISKNSLSLWMKFLTSQPRSANLLADKHNNFINTLKETLHKYVGDIKMTYHSSEKRDPEFLFYDTTKATLNIYSVKPAVFDLLLTIAIVAYLGVLSFLVHIFPKVYSFVGWLSSKSKVS